MRGLVRMSSGIARVLVAPALAGAAWGVYSRLAIDHAVDLPPSLPAVPSERRGPAGRLAVYADRSRGGAPLLLLHDLHVAASAYEVRPLFQHFRRTRTVIAADLPGFGHAERSPRAYTPELYTLAITDLLTSEAQGPADVIAVGRTSACAARAAILEPERVRSLTLISPSGLGHPRPAARRRSAWRRRALADDRWRQAVFDALTSRPALRRALGRRLAGPVDPGLLEHAFLTTHRPGAALAPLALARVFEADEGAAPSRIADDVYAALTVPTLVIYDLDPERTFDELPALMEANGRIEAIRIVPTRGMPQWEKLPETAAALAGFWAGLG